MIMDPTTGIALLGVVIASAVSATACNEPEFNPENSGEYYDGGPEEDTGEDTDTGTDPVIDGGLDPDAGVDPWIRDGFNGKFYQCEYSAECTVKDMDYEPDVDADALTAMTGYSEGRKFTLNIDSANPLNSPGASFASGFFDSVGADVDSEGDIHPLHVVRV